MKIRKFSIKKIITIILVVFIFAGCIALLAVIGKNTDKKISSNSFSWGSIDSEGKFVESKASICTYEMFECQGLKVNSKFDAVSTYSIYFYDSDGKYLQCERNIDGKFDGDVPELAKYARISIDSPDGKDIKRLKINNLANKFKITVSRVQEYKYEGMENLYDDSRSTYGLTFVSDVVGDNLEYKDGEFMKVSEKIKVDKSYDTFDIYVKRNVNSDIYVVSFVCSSDKNIILTGASVNMNDVTPSKWYKLTVKVPDYEGDMYLATRMPKDTKCYIYGYND